MLKEPQIFPSIDSVSGDFFNAEGMERRIGKLVFSLNNGIPNIESGKVEAMLTQIVDYGKPEARKKLSQVLQNSPNAPESVIMKLALENIDIAEPVLRHSPVMSEKMLLELVKRCKTKKISVIAGRKNLSERVILKLMEMEKTEITKTILENKQASLTIEAYRMIVERHHKDKLLQMVASRHDLTKHGLLKLLNVLSPSAAERIQKISKISKVASLNSYTYFHNEDEKYEIRKYIGILYAKNMLNSAVVINFLCKGDVYSFIYSLSKLSGIPFKNLEHIVNCDFEPVAFKKVYEQALLPYSMFNAICLIIRIINSESSKTELTPKNFSKIIGSVILEREYDKSIPKMSYLLNLM